MAVRFDANSDRLLRTSDLIDYNAAYTLMGWIYLSSDLNTAVRIFNLNNNTLTDEDMLGLDVNGTTLRARAIIAGSGNFSTGSNLSVATWYHLAMVRDAAAALKIYLNAALDTTGTRNITGRTANTRLEIGAATGGNSNRFDGRVAYIKAWSAALTLEEVAQEMNVIRPVRTENLYGWWPTFPGSGERAADYSGNGRNWTEGGTLTDEDPPPVSYGARFWVVPFVAAGGPVTIAAALGTLTLTGLAATVAPSGTVNIAAALGALTITELAATVAISGNAVIAANIGALTLTGLSATVVASGTATVIANLGQLSLAGQAATVVASGDVSVAAALGTLALTGLQATVSAPEGIVINANSGALTLTGLPASVVVSGTASVQAALGTLALSGQPAAVTATGTANIAAALGQLALTGLAATVEVGAADVTIVAAVGQLTLTGLPATVVVSGTATVQVSIGLLILAGLHATIMTGTLGTPAQRVFVVAREDRVFAIEREDRVFSVAAENRAISVRR